MVSIKKDKAHPPTYNQAYKIIARFGGVSKTAKLIGVSRISVHRWGYARPYGCDGLVPTVQLAKLKDVARLEGIFIQDKDWIIEKIKYEDKKIKLEELLS